MMIPLKHKFNRKNSEIRERERVHPTTFDKDYSSDELEFFKAVDEYRTRYDRKFPTLNEYYEIFYALGYRKVEGRKEIEERKPEPIINFEEISPRLICIKPTRKNKSDLYNGSPIRNLHREHCFPLT